jgi:hypothetical protein
MLDERPDAGLGRALVWAERERLGELHLIVDDVEAAGVLARRAGLFGRPPRVWQVEGRSLRPAEPVDPPPALEPPAIAREQVALLRGAGVEVVVERGEIRGEVLGLEVARVVVDDGDATGEPTARIEVGVGRHDREAFAMLHGEVPTAAALASVVDKVRRHRASDAEAHPLGRLAAERWLRSIVMADPGAVGARHLAPAEPTIARDGVKDVAPAVAFGDDADSRPLVVACSVGIDLDLVPAAADARQALHPEARLVVVVPERDAHPVTRRLVGALARPAELHPVPGDWRHGLHDRDRP